MSTRQKCHGKKMKKLVALISALFLAASLTWGSSIKTISTSDGLSNNVIFSMCQDCLGYMWIGTSDGLNVWNGHSLEIYDSNDGNHFFAGNTVREMYPDGGSGIWVQTYNGVAHIDALTRKIRYFDSFTHIIGMTCGSDGIAYIISSDGSLYYYNKKTEKFVLTDVRFENEDYKRMHRYGPDTLYCFTATGVYVISTKPKAKTGDVKIEVTEKLDADMFFMSAVQENDKCYFVSKRTWDINVFDLETRSIAKYASLAGSHLTNEMIRAILPYDGGLYIGGSASGVYFISHGSNTLKSTPIKNGIYVLIKDLRQDIIWVGTEGRGVKNWYMSAYNFEEISYDRLPVRVGMPIRTILLDKEGKLWCGTKGDGIFTISGLTPYMDLTERNVQKITTGNSELINNNVYSIVNSGDGAGLWIGSDGPGLNYWSFSEKRLRKVPGSDALTRVHVIYEQDENTLWVSTHGKGAYRCDLKGVGTSDPYIANVEKVEFPEPFNSTGNIFSMYAQNDSLVWFGSRGSGAACLNTRSGAMKVCEFSTPKSKTFNDIYGMLATEKMHFATGCGLFVYDGAKDSYNQVSEIPQRAIHSVLGDESGNIWLSTNYGIVCYNEDDRRCVIHNQNTGLGILEYSDGACYRDVTSGDMFFGGNTGLTIIRHTGTRMDDRTPYIPEINILSRVSNNVHTPLKGKLELPYSDASFGIMFSVVDNINYADYEFSYRILGLDNNWKNNGNNDIIHLPTLPPGEYTLEIRYHNKSNSYTSNPASLQIIILPPIYATWWAKTIYVTLALLIAAYFIRRFRTKYISMKRELELRRQEEGVDPEFLEKILQVINENISDPSLSVSFIIDKMCISRRALYRKLENAPHLKPQQLIKNARMTAVADMLISTALTVEEIMFKVGYDNRSTFYTNFKETYGCTPKEYREKEKPMKSNK